MHLLHADLTDRILAVFYWVYNRLRFGFLESVYIKALANEFERRGVSFEREVAIDVWDQGRRVGHFRADFLIERTVLLEVKAAQGITDADRAQLLNYLRGTRVEVGLLLNFGVRPGFQRMIFTNDRKDPLPQTSTDGTDQH